MITPALVAPIMAVLMLPGEPLEVLSRYQPYVRPAVGAYQPPSDFGREGSRPVERVVLRAPLYGSVTIDAYCGAYEAAPSAAQREYDQGVALAERAADAAAGTRLPLRAHPRSC